MIETASLSQPTIPTPGAGDVLILLTKPIVSMLGAFDAGQVIPWESRDASKLVANEIATYYESPKKPKRGRPAKEK